MALLAATQRREDIPEDLRHLYRGPEGPNGLYRLDIEGVDGWCVQDFSGLKSTIQKLKDKNSDSAEVLSQWRALGMEPAEALAKLKELKELKARGESGDSSPRIEIPEAEIERRTGVIVEEESREARETYLPEIERLRAKDARIRDERERLVREEAVEHELEAAGARVRGPLRSALLSRVHIEQDESGEPRAVIQAIGGEESPRSLHEMVMQMRNDPDFAAFFEPQTQLPDEGPADPHRPKHRSDFADLREKSEWIGAHGIQAFEDLPQAPKGKRKKS